MCSRYWGVAGLSLLLGGIAGAQTPAGFLASMGLDAKEQHVAESALQMVEKGQMVQLDALIAGHRRSLPNLCAFLDLTRCSVGGESQPEAKVTGCWAGEGRKYPGTPVSEQIRAQIALHKERESVSTAAAGEEMQALQRLADTATTSTTPAELRPRLQALLKAKGHDPAALRDFCRDRQSIGQQYGVGTSRSDLRTALGAQSGRKIERQDGHQVRGGPECGRGGEWQRRRLLATRFGGYR